ncbi:DNA recombination protein RmuC [Yinghuangia seranimata]|uniref:DNA recombination protein RmuC n=1 Tax=Yinghuangia seranimata TaxID=408067 RepID=UPI00248AC310|nr:DNA recombination protein RmuC [Yinghuangia seranimata]MDI2125094.1 DNA recombination protein RmuC [Yinghuangia seranimata]
MTAVITVLAVFAALALGVAMGGLLARARARAALAESQAARNAADEARARAEAEAQECRSRAERIEAQASSHGQRAAELGATLAERDVQLARLETALGAAREAETSTENRRDDLAHELATVRGEYEAQGRELAGVQQAAVAFTAERDAARDKVQASERDLAKARAESDGLRSQLADRTRELSDVREAAAKSDGTASALRDELDTLKAAHAELAGRQKSVEQQAAVLDSARDEVERLRVEATKLMEDRFAALSNKALETNRAALLSTAEDKLGAIGTPVRERLDQLNQEVRKLEERRTAAEAELKQQIVGMHEETGRLRDQAQSLVDALKKPQVRGSWGEMTLRRTAELAGMSERCDFEEQVSSRGESGLLRPDMVVYLSDGREAVVDAKVPLKAFMEAAEAADDTTRAARLKDHAQQVRKHIDNLASKEYHKLRKASPEFVIMFIPGEAFLGPALDADRGLLEYALDKGIVITTPTTLMALLRTVALMWTQAGLAENLREVHEIGSELYDRIVVFSEHMAKLGKELGGSVDAYNKAVGSMESRMLVSARRFQQLKVGAKPLPPAMAIEAAPRPLTAAELVEASAASGTLEIPPARGVDPADGSA